MSLCSRCHRRKAKRHCPALRTDLCQLCCGDLRQKKISCPPSCPFLKHQTYQDERLRQKSKEMVASPLEDERLAFLAAQVEAGLHQLAEQNKLFSDREALLALEYARDKIAAGNPRIILAGEKADARATAGEIILKIVNQARYEKGLLLSLSPSGYSREEKIACLETLMALILNYAGGNLDRRLFLEELARRLKQAERAERQKKIILPKTGRENL